MFLDEIFVYIRYVLDLRSRNRLTKHDEFLFQCIGSIFSLSKLSLVVMWVFESLPLGFFSKNCRESFGVSKT